MDILNLFIEKVLDFTVVPVARHVGYVLLYNSNITMLKEAAEKLDAVREDVKRLVSAAENNNEEISRTVQLWQREADKINEKAEKFFQEGSRANTRCFHKLCPNLLLLYKLGRKAKNLAREAVQLYHEGKFGEILIDQMLPRGFRSRASIINEIMEALADPAVHLIGLHGLGGVGKTTLAEQVAKKAQEEELFDKVVVVYVKHSPIKEIQSQIAGRLGFIDMKSDSEAERADLLHQRLEQEKSLLIVLDDLWGRLDFKLVGIPSVDEPNTQSKFIFTSRDESLLFSQMNCKKIIKVEPLSEDEAWVLFKDMAEIDENSDDADEDSDDAGSLLEAKVVTEKCAGLPIAIVAVARALRNNKSLMRKDALRCLNSYSSRNIPGIVDSSIKLSYRYLSEELQPIFLLSAMFSQDPLVMDLLIYAVGLGFFASIDSMEGAWNELDTVVKRLKDSRLLLNSYSNDRFKIHDVVRDVALSIAFEEQQALVRRREKVDEWPNEYQPESCTAICLDESDIDELPEDLKGPKVKFFYLNSNDPELNIPRNFFNGMRELKVLSMSNLTFSSLPYSTTLLKELVTLSLHSCTLEDITVVEYLKELKILNLSHSRIKQLPCEVGQLSSLKVLNLSNCYQLEVIPPNILSNLRKLEELYMKGSFNRWKAKILNEGKEGASLDELKHLEKLSTLEIDIFNASILPKDLFSQNSLKRYKICIMPSRRYFPDKFSRTLILVANNNIDMKYGVFRLFENVEDLVLRKLNGIANLYQSRTIAQTFSQLRAIKVSYCDQLKSLFSVSIVGTLSTLETIEVSKCKSFEEVVTVTEEENVQKRLARNVIEFLQLRTLKLNDLPMLDDFCFNKVKFPNFECSGTQISDRLFSNLKTLVVVNCGFLLKLIPFYILKSLGNLEELLIRSCVSLEVVFDSEELNNFKETYTFRLKSLILYDLPKLKTLWSRGIQGTFSSLQNVNVWKCESLKSIFPASIAKGLIQLEDLKISNCGAEVVVAKDEFPLEANATFVFRKLRRLEINNCNELEVFKSELSDTRYSLFLDEKVAFPNLETLHLRSIKCQSIWDVPTSAMAESSQRRIMSNNPFPDRSFGNLKTLIVTNCNVIKKLVPLRILKSLGNLEKLEIASCILLEVVFDFGELINDNEIYTFRLKRLLLHGLPKLKTVWSRGVQGIFDFQSLQNLSVWKCESLKSIFPVSVDKDLVQLEKLKISNCGAEVVVAKDEFPLEAGATFVFPKLRKLEIDNCNDMEIFEAEPSGTRYSSFLDEKAEC